MTKLFASALALALLSWTAPANAELLKNLKVGGQIDVQATSASNVTDFATRGNPNTTLTAPPFPAAGAQVNNDRIGDVQTRIMLHMDWDLLDDVHARLALTKNDRTYGTTGGNPINNSPTTSQTITAPGGNDVAGNIFVDEANFKVDKVAGQVDVLLGRQFYGESGDIVIFYGPSDKAWYGLPTSSLDAVRADWNSEFVGVTGVVGKAAASPLGVAGQGDTDIRGLNIAFKGNENFKASLYGWNRVIHNAGALGSDPSNAGGGFGGKNDNLYVVGTKARVAGGGFWLKGEFDQNFGENRTARANFNLAPDSRYIGWAAQGNGGYKAESESLGSLGLWGEMSVASGRQNSRENINDGFTAIQGDYRPGSIYGRFSAIPGLPSLGSALPANFVSGLNSPGSSPNLNNRVIWGTGFKVSPGFANRLSVGVSWWDYRLQRFQLTPNANATDPYNGNRHIGSELDVDLVWTHSDNVAFATGWGTFQPGGLIYEANQTTATAAAAPSTAKSGQPVNPVSLAYFDVRIKF